MDVLEWSRLTGVMQLRRQGINSRYYILTLNALKIVNILIIFAILRRLCFFSCSVLAVRRVIRLNVDSRSIHK